MFNNLIESKPKRQRTTGGLIISGILHAILGTAAVYGTLQAKEQLEKPKAEKVEFVEMKKKEDPPPPKEVPPPPKDVVMAPPPPKGFQVLAAPVKVPDVLPDIARVLSHLGSVPTDFSPIVSRFCCILRIRDLRDSLQGRLQPRSLAALQAFFHFRRKRSLDDFLNVFLFLHAERAVRFGEAGADGLDGGLLLRSERRIATGQLA